MRAIKRVYAEVSGSDEGKRKGDQAAAVKAFETMGEQKRVGVAISSIGASKAISLGAYNYALSQLDKIKK